MMTEPELQKLTFKLKSLVNADIAHLFVAVEKCVLMGYERPKKAEMIVDAEMNIALEKASAYVSQNEARRLKVIIGNYHWSQLDPTQQFTYIQKAQEMIENHKFD